MMLGDVSGSMWIHGEDEVEAKEREMLFYPSPVYGVSLWGIQEIDDMQVLF